jgi:hypothetical protein
MSKRFVIILWSLVAALAVITLIVKSQRTSAQESVTALDSGEVILEELPLKELAKFRIEDAEATTTITKGDNQWEVAERADYPVDFSRFSDLLRTLTQMTVAQNMQAGPAFNERFGMDPDSKSQENHGFEITFFNEENEPIESLLIGKPTDSESASFNPNSNIASGRYLRLTSDPNAVYTVNSALSNLTGEPSSWLEPTFIQVRNIQSIAFQPSEKTGMTGWTMSRDDANGEFTMKNLPADKNLDSNKISPLKNALTSPQFEDVLTSEEAAAQRDESQARKAVVTSFDGLTYTLDYAPKKAADTESEDSGTGESFLVSVEIAGELKDTREPAEDETEEEAKAADARFAEKLAASKERLANEKTFEGRSFLVPDYVFSQIDKSQEEFFQKEEVPNGNSPARPSLPRRQFGPGDTPLPANPPVDTSRREAVTDPIAVPAPSQDTAPGEPDSFNELSEEDVKRITEEAQE